MRKLFKHLKPYAATIVAIVVILIVQAYCDLSLPSYTSDIVNVGIQQGGIDEKIPDAIAEEEMNKLLLFVAEEDQQTVLDAYEKKESDSDYKYDGAIYVLKDSVKKDEEKSGKVFDILGKPMLLTYGFESGSDTTKKMEESMKENMISSIKEQAEKQAESMQSQMTDEQKEAVLEHLGMDKSMPEQYLGWLKQAVKGDFGVSLANRTSVTPQILSRLPATLLLMGTALFLSIVLAIPLGLWSGYRKNSWVDNAISSLSYIGMSIPSFWLGMVLVIVFTAKLHLLPSSGMNTVGVNTPWDTFLHMIMPCITLSLGNLATFIRYIRSSTIGELGEEYVLTAQAKGTKGSKILFHHVLKNTLLPIITLIGMNLATLVCGSFIIESVFGWPGIGTFAMEAIGKRDYPIIMAYVMLSGFILVIGNFAADMLYAFADPRIKRGIDSSNGR